MISKTIYQEIKEEYDSGQTQIEIARKFNVGQQIISRLLNGEQSVSGMRLETIEKMFPEATIQLHGDIKNAGNKSGIPQDVMSSILSNSELSVIEKAQLLKELMGKTS